ncbi:MAG: hypothetical protein ACRYG4_16815 [Janthinobacterium lividum]
MPLVLSVLHLPLDTPELRFWQSIATLMGPDRLQSEIIWAFAIWGSFFIGCAVVPPSTKAPEERQPVGKIAGWKLVLLSAGAASLLFGVAWAATNRGLLFRGYADAYDDVVRGPLQGALVYTSVAFVIAFLMRRRLGRSSFLLNGISLIILTILSLSVGTRSMPVMVVIMLVALASRLRGGLSRGVLLSASVVAIAGFSALAAWRQGGGNLRFALLTPALEPLYTYISAATYLAFNDTPLMGFPSPLLGSLANLIPRALWPEKVDFVASLTENIKMFAPLGATHLFASLLINFGWIGGVAASFGAGAGIERLSRCKGAVLTTSYALITAVLATDVWRNPFSQSLIKSVLQGAFLVPAILAIGASAFASLRHRRVVHPIADAAEA